MIIDYSSWNDYEGASEGSGRSEKVWLINEETKDIGLFKFTKSKNTTEHMSEKVASDLALLLGLQCAKIEIGKYKSRVGCMSYLINSDKEILIEGIYLINKFYPSYDPYTMYDYINEEYYSLTMILKSLDEYDLSSEFLKIVIFDFLIGNTDRHQSNWAVLSSENNIRICPMYDNGSSLCCYIEEKNIDSYFGNDKVRFNSLVNTKSRSRIRLDAKIKKEPTHLDVIRHIEKYKYIEVVNLVKLISKSICETSLHSTMSKYPECLLSNKRKKLITKFLLEKVKLLNEVFERKEE